MCLDALILNFEHSRKKSPSKMEWLQWQFVLDTDLAY